MDFDKISKILNPVVDVEVVEVQTIYEVNETTGQISTKVLYNVATSVFPGSLKKIFLIDKYDRISRGHNKLSLEAISNPAMSLAQIQDWYPPFKGMRVGEVAHMQVNDIFNVTPTVHPNEFFIHCEDWKEDLNQLFYQGFMKDPRIVAVFKACMPPLPFNPKKYQRYNNHAFLFTQTKTGKTGFAEEVLGQYVVTEPSAPGLAGGILGSKVRTGALQGTGFCMLDEINATDTEVFDLILNLMEQGVGNRGKVGQPSCKTTKTIMFAGNPEDDAPELLAMDFRNILSTLTRDGANVERVSGRLGLFLYGLDFQKARPIEIIDADEIDILRGIIYDSLSMNKDKFEDILKTLAPEWLFLEDEEWDTQIKKLAIKSKDAKIYQFIKGWKNSVDNMRMAALRWTLLENLDKFILLPPHEFLSNGFKKELQEKYDYIKTMINYPSLENLTLVDFNITYEKFKQMVLSHPSLKNRTERQLQGLFGVGSHNTIRKWLEKVDLEETDENEYRDQHPEIEEINPEMKEEIDDVIKDNKKNVVKKPYI